jgi:transposase-like protein
MSGAAQGPCDTPGMDYSVADRQQEVAELARQRLSLRRIARALGVSHETVRRDLVAIADAAQQQPPPEPARPTSPLLELPPRPPEDGPANLARHRTAQPDTQQQPPAVEDPVCAACGTRHPQTPAYRLPHWSEINVLGDPARPVPLNRTARDVPDRRGLSPWRPRIG